MRLLHTDRYNERSFYQIGYQKVDNRQIRRVFGQRATASGSSSNDGNDEEEDGADEEEPHTPTAAPSNLAQTARASIE